MTLKVLREVFLERRRQDEKWGEQNHDAPLWLSILVEEVGEVAKDINEVHFDGVRCELIQVAAVAVAMVECMDRVAAKEAKHQLEAAKVFPGTPSLGSFEGNLHG